MKSSAKKVTTQLIESRTVASSANDTFIGIFVKSIAIAGTKSFLGCVSFICLIVILLYRYIMVLITFRSVEPFEN